MIIPHSRGPVAEWRFHGPLVRELTIPSIEFAFGKIGAALSVLADERLLDVRKVCFSRWIRAIPGPVEQSKRVDKPAIELQVDRASFLSATLALIRSTIEGEEVYPLDIEIFGSGTVLLSVGEATVADLLWVRGTTLDTFMISIGTQSDVWLPFALDGEPQPEICKLNAGRLVRALQRIEGQIGFQLEEGVESAYSVAKGFQLDNVRYSDGSVADVS